MVLFLNHRIWDLTTLADKDPSRIDCKRVFGNPILLLAFGFGSGLAPRAPGTAGTLAAVPLYLLLSQLPFTAYVGLVLVSCVAGIWICGAAAKILAVHDHPGIVWDEFAGYLVTMLAAPPGWLWLVAGFLLFRLFDIWKPWPIRWVDRNLGGGLGIMLDDLIAALFAGFSLYLLRLAVVLPQGATG